MSRILTYCRRHWPAILAMAYMVWRASREDVRQNVLTWSCVTLGAVGIAMNLLVILANGGMPVKLAADEDIPEEDRPNYKPIDSSTRLAFLADWIAVGNLMISPGDVLLVIGATVLVLSAILR